MENLVKKYMFVLCIPLFVMIFCFRHKTAHAEEMSVQTGNGDTLSLNGTPYELRMSRLIERTSPDAWKHAEPLGFGIMDNILLQPYDTLLVRVVEIGWRQGDVHLPATVVSIHHSILNSVFLDPPLPNYTYSGYMRMKTQVDLNIYDRDGGIRHGLFVPAGTEIYISHDRNNVPARIRVGATLFSEWARSDITLEVREVRTVSEPPRLYTAGVGKYWVGDPYSVGDSVIAEWAFTPSKKIPTWGERINVSFPSPSWDPAISLLGDFNDKIGVFTHMLEFRDDHSLDPDRPGDTTVLSVPYTFTVATIMRPKLTMTWSIGSINTHTNIDISGELYDGSLALNASGGEDGWTNQPIDIIVDPETVLGTFDTVLSLVSLPNIVQTNSAVTYLTYNLESATNFGTPVLGVLTEVGTAANTLSSTVTGIAKIDMTEPQADAIYDGTFSFTDASADALSGISTVAYPTQIAFTVPSASVIPPSTGWEDVDSHTMATSGNYDVWIWATDKAGNEHKVKVFADLYIGGEVTIDKDTNAGAVLHSSSCLNFASITFEPGCDLECSIGLSPSIQEGSAVTYQLILTNKASSGNAAGTFVDYLPKGVVVSAMPIIIPSGSATMTYTLETLPPYAGQYKVSGNYTGLGAGEQIRIEILSEMPAFDKVTPANNILVNQASTDWSITPGPLTGTNKSNYATHELTEIPGVTTLFTKVGADDIGTGLSGAEYVLYRWDGALEPTTVEQNHMVDSAVLMDTTLPGGNWVRVKENGDTATSLTDVFISATSPLGEVNIGSLLDGYYTLIETKAPSGYELPIGQWILTIDRSKTDAIGDYKIEFAGKSRSIMPPAAVRETSGGVHSYKIINARPFTIGMSGLGGTASLLLAGFVLMAVAGNAYAAYSYKQNKKTKK